MNYETLTIPASEIRVGDRIGVWEVIGAKLQGRTVFLDTTRHDGSLGLEHSLDQSWPQVIERPIPPTCPRGEMARAGLRLSLDGRNINELSKDEYIVIANRFFDLWNAAESRREVVERVRKSIAILRGFDCSTGAKFAINDLIGLIGELTKGDV